MDISEQQTNLRANQEDERIELDELLHTTPKKTDSDGTTSIKQTGEAETESVVEAPTIIEVDPESHAQKDDQSCCPCGK